MLTVTVAPRPGGGISPENLDPEHCRGVAAGRRISASEYVRDAGLKVNRWDGPNQE
jgi:hypothetical protein